MDKRLLPLHHAESLRRTKDIAGSLTPPARLLHSVYWNSGRVAMELSSELGLRYVHTVISNGRRRLLAGATNNAPTRVETERLVFRRAHRLISVSRQEKADLVDLYGIDAAKIVVVGRPVSRVFLRPAHDEAGTPRELIAQAPDPPFGVEPA